MRINDALLGLVLMALGVAVFLYARTLPDMPGQNVGPYVFPMVIAIGLVGFSIPLVIGGMRQWRTTGAVQYADWAQSRRGHLNTLITVVLVVLYIAAAKEVGFIPFGVAIIATMLLVQGVAPLPALLTALATTLVVHYAFYTLLRVPLPWGILLPVAW
ncbi:MAG: tripartite tricarboxylate transporter TctB family protein [Rhodospirillaceae bacterium]|nr:tripartite tricarboxylate transporter TctB family protein [Rhodospirillaceae bacterium]